MRKILFVNPSLSRLWGGLTFAVLNLFYSLKEAGIDVELWSARVSGDEIPSEILSDHSIKLFTAEPHWRYSSALKNELELRIGEFDVVHIHGMWLYPHFIASKVAYRAGVPYVISSHGMIQANALKQKWLKKKIYWWLFERISFKRAGAIHTIATREYEQAKKLMPAVYSFLLPNGNSLLPKNPKVSFPNEPVILFVGRLHQLKGIDRLITALKAIPKARLIIAGDGDVAYKNELFGLVRHMGLVDRVEFVGFVDQQAKAALYQRASFLALASHTEVKSLVALEAISHGLPVLITRACDFDEIESHNAGIVIENNTPETIAHGIARMMSLNLSAVSQCAFSLAQKYSLEHVAEIMLGKYEQIIKKAEKKF
ncbi:MAG: glycosyltransferase [Wolinella sp.]